MKMMRWLRYTYRQWRHSAVVASAFAADEPGRRGDGDVGTNPASLGWRYTEHALVYMKYVTERSGARFVMAPVAQDRQLEILRGIARRHGIELDGHGAALRWSLVPAQRRALYPAGSQDDGGPHRRGHRAPVGGPSRPGTALIAPVSANRARGGRRGAPKPIRVRRAGPAFWYRSGQDERHTTPPLGRLETRRPKDRRLPGPAPAHPVLLRDPRPLRAGLAILFSEHHLSHAASSFFCSPFEESAVIDVDGVGEWTTRPWAGTADWRRHRPSSCSRRSASRTRSACSTAPSPPSWASRSTKASTRSWAWRPSGPAVRRRRAQSGLRVHADGSFGWTWTTS